MATELYCMVLIMDLVFYSSVVLILQNILCVYHSLYIRAGVCLVAYTKINFTFQRNIALRYEYFGYLNMYQIHTIDLFII